MPTTLGVNRSGQQDIDGLLSGIRWGTSALTFSFPSSASFYEAGSAPNGELQSFSPLNGTQQNFARWALQQYASVISVTFTEWTESPSLHADLRFARSGVPSTAWAYFPYSGGPGGDSWYNTNGYNNPVLGNYAAHTFMHEIGHAMGLEHGHDSQNPYGPLPTAHDSLEYSVMTYRSYVGAPLNGYTYETWGAPQSLMQDDIAALQYMYGANFNTNAGNTVYWWSASTGQMMINGVPQMAPGSNKIFQTVWDGGGTDTYDFSNYSTGLQVDLQPGAWTVTSGAQRAALGGGHTAVGNIANALLYNSDQRSLIENVVSGTGSDSITGNQIGNSLFGGLGNDVLNGLAGNDFLFGNAGADTLIGGLGNDTFYFATSDGNDVITDFVAGAGSGDVIDFSGYSGLGTFGVVMSYAAQIGSSTVFTFGNGDVLTLNGVARGSLLADDFIYANAVPFASIADNGLNANQWSTVQGWLTYTDVEGNPPVSYQFMDAGTAANSGYFWTPANAHHDANQLITVAAADIGNVWIRGGQAGGTETMLVRANDGHGWGPWDGFTLTTRPNTAPAVSIADHSVQTNQWVEMSAWIGYSDAENSAATQYQFWDGGASSTSGYFWTPSNPHHNGETLFGVSAAEIDNVWLRGGQSAGSETIWVRAFDGTDWSAWDTFTFTTAGNTAPVASIGDHSLAVNQWSTVAGWISYSDAESNSATMYEFWDGGTAATSGYFWTPSNAHHDAGVGIVVSAADLNNVWLRGGQSGGSETLWVRAYDGTNWSAWDSFSLVTA